MTSLALWDLLDPVFDPADVDTLDTITHTRSEWDAIRSDLGIGEGPRLPDPLREERDAGR
jgi:hypothetical protein